MIMIIKSDEVNIITLVHTFVLWVGIYRSGNIDGMSSGVSVLPECAKCASPMDGLAAVNDRTCYFRGGQ